MRTYIFVCTPPQTPPKTFSRRGSEQIAAAVVSERSVLVFLRREVSVEVVKGVTEFFARANSAVFVCNVGGLFAALAAYVALAAPLAASPTLAGRDLGPELQALEVAVSRAPEDADALQALAEAYLERSAPGLAQAALHRAAPSIRGLGRVADLEARSLSGLGLAEEALASQERAIEACTASSESCSSAMLVHAERRVRWLRELVRLSVDDRLPDSAAASLAYRLAVREVRLAVP